MDPREWLFDKRVIRRNLDKGALSMKAYRDYLKALPGLEEEYEPIDVDAGRGDREPKKPKAEGTEGAGG